MSDRPTPPTQRLLPRSRLKRFGGRGDLYAWLRTHHAEIEALGVTHRDIWATLSVEAMEDGVAKGCAGRNLRKYLSVVWRRVVRDLAAESAEKARLEQARAEAPRRPIYPSKISPDWRPEPVVPPAPPRPAAASPGTAVIPARPSAPGTAVTAAGAQAPVPLFPVAETGRSYATRWIPDEELDMTLAPETYEEDGGVIVPMPLDARRRIARFRMKLQAEAERDAWPGGG